MSDIKFVIKRDGHKEPIQFDKIKRRLEKIADGLTEYGNLPKIDIKVNKLAITVISMLSEGVKTSDLDILAANEAYSWSDNNLNYEKFAARLLISNYLKTCEHNIMNIFDISREDLIKDYVYYTAKILFNNKDLLGKHAPLLSPKVYNFMTENSAKLAKIIDHKRSFNLKYRGFDKLDKGFYLLKLSDKKAIETPQMMYLRIAVGIVVSDKSFTKNEITAKNDMYKLWTSLKTDVPFETFFENIKYKLSFVTESDRSLINTDAREIGDNVIEKIKNIYDGISMQLYTYATPTMFNAGTVNAQLSSCFLIPFDEDSLASIMKLWRVCGTTQKYAGGIGVHDDIIRSAGSYIAGTNGFSNGITPNLHVVDKIGKYIDQGGGKRYGSQAYYISPWNADFIDAVEMRKPRGGANVRSSEDHSIFYAMWTSDHFFRCLLHDKDWYMFCPSVASELRESYDSKLTTKWKPEFDSFELFDKNEELKRLFPFTFSYVKLVHKKLYKHKINARDLVRKHISKLIAESGVPYVLSKDNVNRKNMQGKMIYGSNLCTEIVLHTSPTEYAVCNLASIAIPKYLKLADKKVYDCHNEHYRYKITDIDDVVKYYIYDIKQLENIVTQIVTHLDDVIEINCYPTIEMRNANMKRRPIGIGIQGLADALSTLKFEFASEEALDFTAAVQEAIYYFAVKRSAELGVERGSPPAFKDCLYSKGLFHHDLWIQENPKRKIKVRFDWDSLRGPVKNAMRNSMLCANMPTGSTSNIMGNSPCFEPYQSLVYKWRLQSKEYLVSNEHFFGDLVKAGLYTDDILNELKLCRYNLYEFNEKFISKDLKPKWERLKAIYKTFRNISVKDIMKMSIARQPFVDQSQSMNIFMAKVDIGRLINGWIYGWTEGLKTLNYYIKSSSSSKERAMVTKKVEKNTIDNDNIDGEICMNREDCTSCGS